MERKWDRRLLGDSIRLLVTRVVIACQLCWTFWACKTKCKLGFRENTRLNWLSHIGTSEIFSKSSYLLMLNKFTPRFSSLEINIISRFGGVWNRCDLAGFSSSEIPEVAWGFQAGLSLSVLSQELRGSLLRWLTYCWGDNEVFTSWSSP